MRKNLGKKSNQITNDQIQEITRIYTRFEDGEYCRIFDSSDFGYRKVYVDFPMRDGKGEVIRDQNGNPTPDSSLRDAEYIPLAEDVDEYFKREVFPYTPDAWVDRTKDKVGYEISFARYFHKYRPLRMLKDIAAEILAIEKETEGLLKEVIDR
jgi:type I restriction enzyme M protein